MPQAPPALATTRLLSHMNYLLFLFLLGGPLFAQTTISSTQRYAYTANAGWIDFRSSESDGVRFTETYLTGKAYAANFGWIDFGDATPSNGYQYGNNSANDYGVNLTPEGHLSGYAYSANTGWISFEQTRGQPRLDFLTGQVTGYAWSANLGWIALDTPSSDLSTSLACPDTDFDDIGDAYEYQYFGNLTTASDTTDTDGDGANDAAEFTASTNPLLASDRLRILTHSYAPAGSNIAASFTFTSSPNRLYRLQYDADLLSPWTGSSPGSIVPGAGATTSINVSVPSGPKRFFRIEAFKPLQP